MKICNLDNEYLFTHRYGWHKIINDLLLYVNSHSNIILVDFMDKYFNLWFEMTKTIDYDSKCYNFLNKDVYYHLYDINKSDAFIYYNEFNIYYIFKWFEQSNEFKILQGELKNKLIKKYNIEIIKDPWIGILHYPEFVIEMNYESYEALPNILKSKLLIESIKYCKCIITLSEHLKNYLEEELIKHNYNIPIRVLYHPTDFNCKLFNIDNLINNTDKKIIQVGFWMRKLTTIYLVKTELFSKYWLPGGKYWKEMFSKMYPNYEEYLNDDSVTIKMYLDNNTYDDLLSENICLVDVFNSSANNTVLECIARNTPLLAFKHPAIVEYLGIEYPLYFESINELNEIINSSTFIDKVIETHNYLKNMNKERFTIYYFCKLFYNIIEEFTA
jgi:hypothetical protein